MSSGLNDAFDNLARAHPACHAVAVHRIHHGLSVAQVAAELVLAEKTVLRRWTLAKAYLGDALGGPAAVPA